MSTEEPLKIGNKTRIAEVGDWDYSWSLFAVFADDGGRLYSVTDSGCSCYSPYEFEEDLDWKPLGSIHDAIKEARAWNGASNKDIEDFVADLMEYRKAGNA
jgi:hypothetical protein